MKHTERHLVTRHELAARLRQLADQWERGDLAIGYVRAAAPELAEMEVALTLGESLATLGIKVEWRREAARRLA